MTRTNNARRAVTWRGDAAGGCARRSPARAGLVALALAGVAALSPDTAGAATGTCRTTTVSTTAGAKVTLKLDCRVGRTNAVLGSRGRVQTTVVVKPKLGKLGALTKRTGRIAYTARVAGRDVVRFRVRSRTRSYQGAIVLRIAARPLAPVPAITPSVTLPAPVPNATATPDPVVTPTPTPTPGDGLPEPLPAVPASVASSTRAWVAAAADTCPAAVHDRYSVVGPDGRRYPTWHPPTTIDPGTGRACTFGHEHGDDPKTSDIEAWVADHLQAPGYEQYAGLPFGTSTEALDAFAAANPGTAKRSEDHVGYKVSVANDVALLGPDGAALGTTCDYLTSVHQGSHSPDALSNNAHELVYAVRCSDGTEVISTTVSRFGEPGVYGRGCEPETRITTVDNGYPAGPGARLIPDRECVERNVLVPSGRTTSVWALYEKWTSINALELPGGAPLARFETSFGVFNPSRYASTGTTIGRTLPLCWETAADGDKANGVDCANAITGTPFDDARSPFDGTRRDVYLAGTKVENPGGTRLWWTDPYGRNASPTPFPGGVCQLVSAGATPGQGDARIQVFGRNHSYDAPGVHAPN
ncbi:hypothetical protein OJ997_10470 [Solirubrobacter phytolaccae]|uniref:Uncharacterized protein n=1 Tax=Solirubrobacter phytolaccae TaxID=1404360 RepID=A0A9X3NGE5_9ACTN|nr:hypothetical protein [Solirubrobacter phytolaccae]MDA0180717.1 hypothetical protein [Solirubrobacter phytolaccae]